MPRMFVGAIFHSNIFPGLVVNKRDMQKENKRKSVGIPQVVELGYVLGPLCSLCGLHPWGTYLQAI